MPFPKPWRHCLYLVVIARMAFGLRRSGKSEMPLNLAPDSARKDERIAEDYEKLPKK